jgi:hypothetical protein
LRYDQVCETTFDAISKDVLPMFDNIILNPLTLLLPEAINPASMCFRRHRNLADRNGLAVIVRSDTRIDREGLGSTTYRREPI